jgi:hypothetical protein
MDCPVFVFGALRSGTTVFRLMLDAHPEINHPGEANVIFDRLWETPLSDEWIYDFKGLSEDLGFQDLKLFVPQACKGADVARGFVKQLRQRSSGILVLNVHRNLGKIAFIFPDAKVIHLIRDPRDVAKSCIGMGWAGNTYYGVDAWISTERNWNDYSLRFNSANLLLIRYGDLIRNPRKTLERVCDFLGVRYAESMLCYADFSTYDAPDPSLVGAWRSKLSKREIALVEMKVGPLLKSRGYEPSAFALERLGWIERFLLYWQNQFYKWNFVRRRYGLFNMAMEILTRRIFRARPKTLVNRMNEITRLHLK